MATPLAGKMDDARSRQTTTTMIRPDILLYMAEQKVPLNEIAKHMGKNELWVAGVLYGEIG